MNKIHMPETIRVTPHSETMESLESNETPGKAEVLQWLNRNRRSIESLLRKGGDVRLQMSKWAMKKSKLDHQHVMITQSEPHELRTADGQRLLASFDELETEESAQHQTADVA